MSKKLDELEKSLNGQAKKGVTYDSICKMIKEIKSKKAKIKKEKNETKKNKLVDDFKKYFSNINDLLQEYLNQNVSRRAAVMEFKEYVNRKSQGKTKNQAGYFGFEDKDKGSLNFEI